MSGPFHDPFVRPGVADEIEAQLQTQEERRAEAARLANAEREIAKLSAVVRRGILAVGTLAFLITLLAALYLAGIYPRRSENPIHRRQCFMLQFAALSGVLAKACTSEQRPGSGFSPS